MPWLLLHLAANAVSGFSQKNLVCPLLACSLTVFYLSVFTLQHSAQVARTGDRNTLMCHGLPDFWITEAPLRLPSVRTTCSGLRDCTVVCTLVRLCWDIPHSLLAPHREWKRLHWMAKCCMPISPLPSNPKHTPFYPFSTLQLDFSFFILLLSAFAGLPFLNRQLPIHLQGACRPLE